MHYKRLILFVFGFIFLSVGTAFAANPSWFSKAQSYVKDRCSKRIISDEVGLLCYVFGQVQDHNAAITRLDASASALLSTVNNLQTNSGKSLHVVDANNQDLGIYVSDDQSRVTVFVPSVARRLTLEYSTGNPSEKNFASFASSDCTGTPYIFVSDNKNYYLTFVATAAPGKTYATKTGVQPVQFSSNSYYGYNFDTNQYGCFPSAPGGTQPNWYEAQEVQLPFTLPAAKPLSFKYF